jgi:transcriptional regulator with XRE-family HTH domain
MEGTVDEPISELIRRMRVRHELTQAALADRLAELSGNPSVTRDQVTRWERGGRVPSPYWRRWLSVTLEVPPGQLDRAARCARAVRLLSVDAGPRYAAELERSPTPYLLEHIFPGR